jgi:hypothetical protein
VTYIFMVILYRNPEQRDDLIRGMVERAELMASTPDLIDAGPGDVHAWGARPRELFHIESPSRSDVHPRLAISGDFQ